MIDAAAVSQYHHSGHSCGGRTLTRERQAPLFRNGRTRKYSRRQAFGLFGGAVLGGVAAAGGALAAARRQPETLAIADAGAVTGTGPVSSYRLTPTGYTPDGTAGALAAFPLSDVRLLESPFYDNQQRNLAYLLFLDPERMLRAFRLNYGEPSSAAPAGGWEAPGSLVRGHTSGHLLSGLALSYANTGDPALKAKAEYLVAELARLQQRAPAAGYSPGYLSAFPEEFFDWLETGLYRRIWSPYYMIHKYLAGMIDAYQLAGVGQALDVAVRLADWVDRRTARLTYQHMQAILNVEFGGLPEALANLYRITGSERYLVTAQRFYHAAFLDPLAAGQDDLADQQCNVSVPKVIASLRMWEETGEQKYRDIAENFWSIATGHHTYAIGGMGDHEHWGPPDVVAAALSNYTCEGCVTYNTLKLTRLLHCHDIMRMDLLDFYERGLFNQMLGTQDPQSPHGFVCYYTGLSSGAVKRQPLNYFPAGDPDIYATDYDTFTCDNATALETASKFADTIYSRDPRGVWVNLFIPSEVNYADAGITLRQTTGFPDDPTVRLTVASGSATMALRVRVPGWTAGAPVVTLNGAPLAGAVVAAADGPGGSAGAGGWVVVTRQWSPGDELAVTLPMTLAFSQAPDLSTVVAASYGPVVLAGLTGNRSASGGGGDPADEDDQSPPTLPSIEPASVRRVSAQPMTFQGTTADGNPITLLPVARVSHEPYTVYWQAGDTAFPLAPSV